MSKECVFSVFTVAGCLAFAPLAGPSMRLRTSTLETLRAGLWPVLHTVRGGGEERRQHHASLTEIGLLVEELGQSVHRAHVERSELSLEWPKVS